MVYRRGFGLLCSLLLICGGIAHAAGPVTNGFAADPVLQRRVSITANGIPLRYLLKRIETVTGVRLAVSGRIGDERAIVLVPDAPLHTVMTSLAELYRLEWTRTAVGDRWKYALAKPANNVREETEARERSFRAAYAEWVQRETDARDPLVAERPLVFRVPGRPPIAFDAGLKECQARLLPLARPELPRLLREGVLTQPLAQWPEAEREGAVRAVRTWLDNEDNAIYQLYHAEKDVDAADGGAAPVRARRVRNESRAEESSLRIALDTHPQLFLSASVLTPDGESHGLSRKRTFISNDAGNELYAGRSLRPVKAGATPHAALAETDPLSRRLAAGTSPEAEEMSLVDRLRQVSTASGLSVYADDYSGTWLLSNRRPAEGYSAAGGTGAEILDAICRQDAHRGSEHSYWWRQCSSVFLRSRNWLWESEAVIPSDLPQSLAAAIRRTGRPGAPNLHRMATLSGLQAASLQSRPGALVAWKYFLQATDALSLATRFRLANGELSWTQLPDTDRALLFRLLPVVRSQPETYSVRLESWLQRGDGGHHTAVVTMDGRCGKEKFSTGLRIPVPDLREGLAVSTR